MSTRQKRRSRISGLFVPLFCIALISYFVFHAFQGQFGMQSRLDLENRALELEFQLASLKKERELLAKRVSLIKSGTLERDMVDERARYSLNLLHPNEIVISLD